MAEHPHAAVEAVIAVLSDPHGSGYPRSMNAAGTTAAARRILDAAAPHILAAAGKVLTEDQAREIMQQQGEAEKPRLLAEVAAATDERLEQCVTSVRQRIALAIFAQKQPCPDHPMPLPKPSCWTCGRNGAFERAARIAAGLHKEVPGDDT